MSNMINEHLENSAFWIKYPCGIDFSRKQENTLAFVLEVETERYKRQPYIFSFAQFTRFYGKKILEVGTGLGTDFTQWTKAGAICTGVDLTQEALNRTKRNLELRGLKQQTLIQSNAEKLPFEDNTFDLVYSWGCIHHTDNVPKAFHEILRVTAPGGKCKIMVYNLFSMVSFYIWLRHALFKLRPWKSLSWGMENFIQNKGTKAYIKKDIEEIFKDTKAKNLKIQTVITYADKLEQYNNKFLTAIASTIAYLLGWDKVGLYLLIEFDKQ